MADIYEIEPQRQPGSYIKSGPDNWYKLALADGKELSFIPRTEEVV